MTPSKFIRGLAGMKRKWDGLGRPGEAPKRQKKGNGNNQKVVATKRGARTGVTHGVTKKTGGGKRKKPTLKKRVAILEKNMPKEATYEYRWIRNGQLNGVVAAATYDTFVMYDSAAIEASIDALKYVNDAGAVINVDTTALGIRSEIQLKDFYSKIVLRNNFQLSAHVDVYGCVCIKPTASPPLTTMTDDDGNVGITNAESNIHTYPSDFKLFRQHWKIAKHAKVNLRSGDSAEVVYSRKYRKYDPELHDVSNTYEVGDFVWFLRTVGGVSHDATATTSVGTADPTIDVVINTKWKVKYPSDLPFHYIETLTTLSTQGNGAVQAGATVNPALT